MQSPSLAYALIAFALLLAACAHHAAPPAQDSAQSLAPGATLRQFTIETPNAVRGAGDVDELARALREVGRDAGVELRGDGRLAQLAERFTDHDPEPAFELVQAAQELGLADAMLVLERVRAQSGDLLAASLRVRLPPRVQQLHATHFGVHVLPGGDAALVVLSRRPFVLDAVPDRVVANGELHLRGRRAADVHGAKLLWRDPVGRLRTIALGSELELDVRLPLVARGRHHMELSEQGFAGERVALAFDVEAGASGENAFREIARQELVGVRSELFAQLSAFRSERGLSPFADDAALDRRAEQGCRADANTRAADAKPEDLPAATSALQSTSASGLDASALFEALLADPALHARLLGTERMRLGLAICTGPTGLHALALFAAPSSAALSAELASGRVLLGINAHRRSRNVPPLRPDAALTEVAQHGATALQQRPDANQSEIIDQANAELERFALRYRRVAAVAVVVHDAGEAATLEPALESGASVIGIATAELRASDPTAPHVAVVLAIGWER